MLLRYPVEVVESPRSWGKLVEVYINETAYSGMVFTEYIGDYEVYDRPDIDGASVVANSDMNRFDKAVASPADAVTALINNYREFVSYPGF